MRRSLQIFLETFLEAFTSRRSEYDGYWLFGFLTDPELHLDIDLLVAAPLDGERPSDVAKRRAEQLFFDGLSAQSFDLQDLTTARLTVRAHGPATDQMVAGVIRRGQPILCELEVVHGSIADRAERILFVAPHDPGLEQASQPPFDEGEGRDT